MPAAALAYNCHIHRSTKESPFFLTYIHDPRLPFFDLEQPKTFAKPTYAQEQFTIAYSAYEKAKENLEQASKTQKDYYDRRAKIRKFKLGEMVNVYFPNPPPGQNSKFYTSWQPGIIVKLVGNLNAIVKLDKTGRQTLIHLNRIRHAGGSNALPRTTYWEDTGVSYPTCMETKRERQERITNDLNKLPDPDAHNPEWQTDEELRKEIGKEIERSREMRQQGAREDEEEEEQMGEDARIKKKKKATVQRDDATPQESSEESSEEYSSEGDDSSDTDTSLLGPWLKLATGIFPSSRQTRSMGPAPEQPLVPSCCLAWQQRKERK